MLTDVQIINNGLAKIAASRIKRIDPPSSPLEGFMASNYTQWKRSEIAKRRWVFALEKDYALTLDSTLVNVDKPYKFLIPADCLRPIRTKYSEWDQVGRYIRSNYETLAIDFIRNKDESEFDVLFNDVLASRISYESAEYVTQSNKKKEAALAGYQAAVRDAAKNNAFVIGPEDIQADDNDYSWVSGRYA